MRVQALAALVTLMLPMPVFADEVDRVIADQMEASHLPGVAVAIIDAGEISKLSGYGDANLEWPAKVDADTRFQLASATKLFTGVLLMRAVEQGKLSLDDTISKFFPGAPASWSFIRVRQLANHTSGLSENLGQPRPKTIEEAVAASMKQPLAYEPGTEARYGFTDFTVLRAILEQVNDATLPAILDRELIRPLGLTGTGFALAEENGRIRTGELVRKRASIYAWTGQRQRTSDFFFEPLGYGAGGLYSTVRDLAVFFSALDRNTIISSDSLRELTSPAVLSNGRKAGFGVGWTAREYHGVPIVGHSGGPALADIVRIPSQSRTIVVLTNQQNFYPVLAERIADLTIPKQPHGGVDDDRPVILSNLLGVFAAVVSQGEVASFLAPGSKAADPLMGDSGRALIDAVGPLRSAELVRVEADGSRVYRLQFERKQWDWSVTADETGKILQMRPA